MINVRKVTIEDAALLSRFLILLDQQSQYTLYESGERKGDILLVENFLKKICSDGKSAIYIAYCDEVNEIIGYVCGEVSNIKRLAHVMTLNVGVLQPYYKSGIATKLLQAIFSHAELVGIVRFDALVVESNLASLKLVAKLGFELEGVKRNYLFINNVYHNVLILSKIAS